MAEASQTPTATAVAPAEAPPRGAKSPAAPARIGPAGYLLILAAVGAAALLGWNFGRGAAPGASELRVGGVEELPPSVEHDIVTVSDERAREMAGVELTTIATRPVSSEIVCNGYVGFNENRYAQIRLRVDGILKQVRTDVGAPVHAGQELAVLDSATLGEYKSSYVYAMINVKYTEGYCDRLRKLADQQAIPSKTLFEMEHMLQEQRLDAAKSRQRLVNLGFDDQQIDAFVAENDTHAEMAITAPWDGTLVQRHAVEGEAVTSNVPVFAIANLETMWVHLSAYESDLGKIRLDQPLVFVPDGLEGQEFPGHVTWISPEVDPQTRTIQVRGEVTNVNSALRANMFGKGKLTVASAASATVAPSSAVQMHDGHYIVMVHKKPGEYEGRRVTIGIRGAHDWEVTSGLEPGERVVTTGSFLLKSNLENPSFGQIE